MDARTLRVLEYNKIIDRLENLAFSDMAKKELRLLVPYEEINKVNRLQDETQDAKGMIVNRGTIDFSDVKDMTAPFARLDAGGSLSILELMRLLYILECSSKAKRYYQEQGEPENSISYLFRDIITLIDLQNEIKRCIISEEEIADDASSELKNIRRQIKSSQVRVKEKLNELINSSSYKSYLQDPVITIRGDRYCIPIKAEAKSQVKGIVHDESATGSTLFIEPMQVVEINNGIRILEAKEKEEIERILAVLSDMAYQSLDIIKSNYKILIKLDIIFAKGMLSKEMDGSRPIFKDDLSINLKLARHPLIDKDAVVPINVSLGKDFNQLIITGPNTGGKTVTLKTIGLLSLMGQSGLHIPAYDNSELAIFDNIFCDIGDEQSIEQNLSTFSSHMKNIVDILEKVTEKSLVLFDELGAGTDPIEGAALAMSILKTLKEKNIHTVATTHFSELKHYALETEGVMNASCEFDIESLSPTYKLIMGVPGKSNAFLISSKLGLNSEIIDRARGLMTEEEIKLEDLLRNIELDKAGLEEERSLAAKYKEEIEKMKLDIEEQKLKFENEKNKIIMESKLAASKVYEEANDEAKKIMRQLREKAKSLNKILDESEVSTLNNILDKNLKGINKDIEKESLSQARINTEKIKVSTGDRVYISTLDKDGIVLTTPDSSSNILVEVGIMKINVNMKYVFKSKNIKDSKKRFITSKTADVKKSVSNDIKFELNIIGMYPSEALVKLEKFIDDALIANMEEIRIVHGKGTGVLRKEVHNVLKDHPAVSEYRLGMYGEGEDGVTIVKLK